MARTFAVLVALALPLVAAPVPKGMKAKKSDAERIVGIWVQADSPNAADWFFNADGTCGVGDPDKPGCRAIYKMDETQTPPHLDWSQDDGKSWYLDAYELSGDVLKMSAVGPGGVRPTTVDPKNGHQWIHLIRKESKK
jgi:hypothetical protein